MLLSSCLGILSGACSRVTWSVSTNETKRDARSIGSPMVVIRKDLSKGALPRPLVMYLGIRNLKMLTFDFHRAGASGKVRNLKATPFETRTLTLVACPFRCKLNGFVFQEMTRSTSARDRAKVIIANMLEPRALSHGCLSICSRLSLRICTLVPRSGNTRCSRKRVFIKLINVSSNQAAKTVIRSVLSRIIPDFVASLRRLQCYLRLSSCSHVSCVTPYHECPSRP